MNDKKNIFISFGDGLYTKNGIFYIRPTIEGKQKWITLNTKDKKVAYARQHKFQEERILAKEQLNETMPFQLTIGKKSRGKSLTTLIDEFLEYSSKHGFSGRGNTWSTLKEKKTVLNKLIKSDIHNLSDLTDRNRINQFYSRLELKSNGESYGKRYVDTSYAYFKSFIKWLSKERLVKFDDIIFSHRISKTKARNEYLTLEQIEAILNYAKYEIQDFDFYLMLMTLFYTFSRKIEIDYLKVKDIDFINDKFYIKQTKTDKSKVIPHISGILKNELKSYIDINHLTPESYVFEQNRKYPGAKKRNYHKNEWQLVKAHFNLPSIYTLHIIRHSSCSYLWKSTKDIKLVSKLSGDSEEVVLRNYINMDDDELKFKLKNVLSSSEKASKTEGSLQTDFENTIKEIREKVTVTRFLINTDDVFMENEEI